MQFVYLRTCVSHWSTVQVNYFLQLDSIFYFLLKCREEGKTTREKIKCRWIVLQRFNLNVFMLLCVTSLYGGQYQFLGKIATHFSYFHVITPQSQMKIFMYFTYLFLLEAPLCPQIFLLINHIFSWKSKLKHTVVDIECFFQVAKSSLTKYKQCLLEVSYRTS